MSFSDLAAVLASLLAAGSLVVAILAFRRSGRAGEQWLVDWTADWDSKSLEIVLRQHGRDAARKPSAVVRLARGRRSGERYSHDRLATTPKGAELRLPCPWFEVERDTNILLSPRSDSHGNSLQIVVPATITVYWQTRLGQSQHQELQVGLR